MQKEPKFPPSERASGLLLSGCAACTIACDMTRGSIYRCYGIIPTIKELFQRPGDLRLASQDTESDPGRA